MSGTRIFIGTSDVSVLEESVLRASIERTTPGARIYRLDGDTQRIVGDDIDMAVQIPSVLRERYVTRFTAMRFAIPAACGFDGLAIYLDSDQIVLDDLNLLASFLPEGAALGAVNLADAICGSVHFRRDVLARIAPPAHRHEFYLASVLVFDTARCRLSLDELARAVEEGLPYDDLIWLGPRTRERFGLDVYSISPLWNCLDARPPGAKLVHFTAINTQPWTFSHYTPTGRFWLEALREVVRSGRIGIDDVERQFRAGRLSPRNRQRILAWLEEREPGSFSLEIADAVAALKLHARSWIAWLARLVTGRNGYWNFGTR